MHYGGYNTGAYRYGYSTLPEYRGGTYYPGTYYGGYHYGGYGVDAYRGGYYRRW